MPQRIILCISQVPSANFDQLAGDTATSQPLRSSLLPMLEAPFPCKMLTFALLDADHSPELLCLGSLFPRDVRVFQHDRWHRKFQDVTATFQAGGIAAEGHSAAALTVQDVCMGDFNLDGFADYAIASQERGVVVWMSTAGKDIHNPENQSGYWYTIMPLWPFRVKTESDEGEMQSATSVCCVDFDNDGTLDIFALYATDRIFGPRLPPNGLFLNHHRGQLKFACSLTDPRGGSTEQADTALAGDYDSDGLQDLLLVSTSGSIQLFRNEFNQRNTSHWLELTLHGTEWSNSLARGTVVQIIADGGAFQLSQVAMSTSMGNTVSGQHHHRLHFGLGSHAIVEKLHIFWPDTEPQSYDSVAVDQHLHIMEAQHTLPPNLRRSLAGYHFRDGGCAILGQQRLQPSVFIIGQWKCGTTSLASALADHPLILPSTRKELHYFMVPKPTLPLAWYKQQFPCGSDGQLTFEASASYLFYSSTAPQLLAAYPQAKLIVLLS